MYIFINKKGNSLIEVIMAMALLYIFILGSVSLEVTRFKLKAYNKKKENYVLCMEAVKASIINDISYEKIIAFNNVGKKYIHFENIKMNNMPIDDFCSLFSSEIDTNKPYIEIIIEESKQPLLKISLRSNTVDARINEEVKCNFYKGSYH